MLNKIITNHIIMIIKFYQFFISPILGQNCRYLPTCSEYSIQSIKKFWLTVSVWFIFFQNLIPLEYVFRKNVSCQPTKLLKNVNLLVIIPTNPPLNQMSASRGMHEQLLTGVVWGAHHVASRQNFIYEITHMRHICSIVMIMTFYF